MQKKTYILFFMLHFCISVVYSSVTHYNNQDNPQRKGMHWIIQDLAADTETFVSKELKIDFGVQNAREGNSTSWIDVYCADCSEDGLQLLVEYKHGPQSITSNKIKEQLIERDLFNATNLNQIQWRLKDTGFTPEKLKAWMKEHKSSIDNLIQRSETSQKFKNWFNLESFENTVTNSQIDDFVDTNYNLIFK